MHKKALLAILLSVAFLLLPAHSTIQFAAAQNPVADLAAKGAAAFGKGGIELINTIINTLANAGGLLATVISVGLSIFNSLITFIICIVASNIISPFVSIIVSPIVSIIASPIPSIISFIMSIIVSPIVSSIVSLIATIILKIVAAVVMVASYIEPIFKYIQSVVGVAILEYLAGYKDLIYYGFVRVAILDVVLAGVYAVMTIINIIGIIPIVSIPMALIFDYIVIFVLMPLISSIVTYFPEENINPIAQGMNSMKIGLGGAIFGIVEILIVVLLIVYTIGMIVPIVNIFTAIITVFVSVIVGILVCIILPIIAWITNIIYILPTILNYTPFINLIKRGGWRLVVMIEDLIFKGIDNIGAWIA